MAVRPISAKVAQVASLTPLAELRMALRFSKSYWLARYLPRLSASCCCSSLYSKFMSCPLYSPRLILAMMLRWISFDPA